MPEVRGLGFGGGCASQVCRTICLIVRGLLHFGENVRLPFYGMAIAPLAPASDGANAHPKCCRAMAAQRILVIEDEPGAREAMESLLSEEGYTVASAEN